MPPIGHMDEEGSCRPEQHCIPPQPSPYPWLVYFNNNVEKEETKNQIFCSILDPTITYSTSIPELMWPAVKVWTIQHGWCLLENLIISNTSSSSSNTNSNSNSSDRDHRNCNLFLYSPSNFNKIELPQLKLSNDVTISYCIFSSSPTATDQVCSIFLFALDATIIFYCQLGDQQWTQVDYDRKNLLTDPAFKYKTVFTNPLYCNGTLYAESRGNNVLVEIQKHELRGLKIKSTGVSLPTSPISMSSIGLHHTIHCFGSNDNQLFRILISHSQDKVIGVVVHRYDFSLRMWEKVSSIKDKAFFISISDSNAKSNSIGSRSHFVCQAINSETEGGRVYLALKDNNFVYIYNIEDNSLMISQYFSNLPKNRSCSMWFMPESTYVRSSTDVRKIEIIREYGAAIHLKEAEDKATNINLYTLPLDVVEAIAKYLNVHDYLHFRATNRHFRLGALPLIQIQWKSRFNDLSMSPLLVLSDKYKVFTFVHPKQGLKYKYTINFPPQAITGDEIICYSKDGWLLLASRLSAFFFNPFTKQVLPLSHERGPIMNYQCVGFSHPPTSFECAVIEYRTEGLSYLTFPGGQWIPCNGFLKGDINKFPLYNISPVFFNGSFHYLSVEGKLGVMQVLQQREDFDGGLSWKELEEPRAPLTNYTNSFLVECDGNLLSVFEGETHFQKWVQVFKLNEPTMTWIKIESLESYMLFVSGKASFSCVATIPGMENKIYFPRFYGQNIVFYSLETNNYHTFENEVLNFYHVREQLNSSWIQPRWH